MNITKIKASIRSRLGRRANILTASGARALVEVISVDDEGFTYNLIEEDVDRSVIHWWPFDEVASVDDPATD